MNKPRLTKRVIRGLLILTNNAPVVEYVNGNTDRGDIAGFATEAEIQDAQVAKQWVVRTNLWKMSQQPPTP